jgi:site-specific DNA-methyltransferase (adenine-specific)
MREVWRCLRFDGTLWLNLGDKSIATRSYQVGETHGGAKYNLPDVFAGQQAFTSGLPDKNISCIPWRVALALQADGWILRRDIIWEKPNVKPESVTDRPTTSHEYLFLFSKSQRYFFDRFAIQERAVMGGWRNRRSVWHINTQPYAGAHFAAYPPDMVSLCVLAGTSAYGVCATCGAPWRRAADQTIWEATCQCAGRVTAPVVMDPFSGSGTTGAVCQQHGRAYIGVEINPQYVALAQQRTANVQIQLLQE